MTPEQLKQPGIAWNLAAEAMKKGDLETAKQMLPHMVESDREIMERRIAQAERRGQGDGVALHKMTTYTCPKCERTLKAKSGHTCGTDPALRFWPKVKKGDGCWIWQGCRSSVTRYGTFRFGERNINAHRAAYILTYGPIPMDLDVLHTCNNGHIGCVTPHHLYLGTDQENSDDRLKAGTHWSKVKPDDVREIRAAFEGITRRGAIGAMYRKLAAKYGIGEKQIWTIRVGRQWKHIKETTNVR